MSRAFPATIFAGAVLAFTLPFGAVSSCDGEEVRFTGVEVAAFDVEPYSRNGTLHSDVERNAGAFAFLTLTAAFAGLVVSLLGRPGGGVCAGLGLAAFQALIWALALTADGLDLFVGFWLCLLSLVTAGVVHLVQAVRRRRIRGARSWGYAFGRVGMVLTPTLGLLGIGLVLAADGA